MFKILISNILYNIYYYIMLKGLPWGGYKIGWFIFNIDATFPQVHILPLIGKNPKKPMLNVDYVMITIVPLPFQHFFKKKLLKHYSLFLLKFNKFKSSIVRIWIVDLPWYWLKIEAI
jgi:hypothetical protein